MPMTVPANWMNLTAKAPRVITIEGPSYTVQTPDGEAVTLKAGDSLTINVSAPPKSGAQIAYEAHSVAWSEHLHKQHGSPSGFPPGVIGWDTLTPWSKKVWEAVAERLRDHFEDEF